MTKITLEFKEDKEFIRKWLAFLYSELGSAAIFQMTHSPFKKEIPKKISGFGKKFFEQLEKEIGFK